MILLAHNLEEKEWLIGDTIIIGVGKDSESISIIEVKKNNREWDFLVERIKMKKELQEDKEILNIIKMFNNSNRD